MKNINFFFFFFFFENQYRNVSDGQVSGHPPCHIMGHTHTHTHSFSHDAYANWACEILGFVW